jgi:hypothetical protein
MSKAFRLAVMFAIATQAASLSAKERRGANLRDLRNSVHCLADDPFQLLGRGNAKAVSLIVSPDDRSWPGEHNLWIFIVRGNGIYDAFLVEITAGRRRHYEIQNNATIRWDGRTVVDFRPLLGGIWTHEVMRRNFRKALKSAPISLRPFARGGQSVECGSYTSKARFH